jgi:hypothetical protein
VGKSLWNCLIVCFLSLAATTVAAQQNKIRVYVTDSQSWEISGGFSGASSNGTGAVAGHVSGGARPQTVEIIKTLNQRCPEITVTSDRTKAAFVILLDHEGGKGYLSRRNKIAVFNRDGDAIFSNSTRSLGNAVKDACDTIINHSL